MKMGKIIFSLIVSLTLSSVCAYGGGKRDGWYNTSYLEKKADFHVSKNSLKRGELSSHIVSMPSSAPSGKRMLASASFSASPLSDEIINLSNKLDNDASKIIEYVKDNIKDELYYGVKKGALITLCEKSGNDCDKIVLAMALLKAAGLDENYYIAKTLDLIPITNDELGEEVLSLEDILGIDIDAENRESVNHAIRKLFSTRIPYLYNTNEIFSKTVHYVVMPRHKICHLNGNDSEIFDLNAKKRTLIASDDVKAIGEISSSDILTTVGGTLNASKRTVASLNSKNLETSLKKYASNIASFAKKDLSRSASDIVGGVKFSQNKIALNCINKDEKYNIGLSFNDFYRKSSDEIKAHFGPKNVGYIFLDSDIVCVIYKGFPSEDYAKLNIFGAESSVSMNLSSLNGDRLWVYFEGNTGFLKQENLQLISANVEEKLSLNFEIRHAYDALFDGEGYAELASKTFIQEESFLKNNSYVYNVAYGFSDAGGLLAIRNKIFSEKIAAAKLEEGNFNSDGSLRVVNNNLNPVQKDLLAESLNIMGLTWLSETYKSDAMISNAHGCFSQFDHRLGKIAQEKGFYIDINMQLESHCSSTSNEKDELCAFRLTTLFFSAMEHGVIQQLQNGADAVSTVNILQHASDKKSLMLLSNPDHVDQLSNYSDAEKQILKDIFANDSDESKSVVLIPQNRTCVPSKWKWKGFGYIIFSPSRAGMMISGNLNGGYSVYESMYNPGHSISQISSSPNYYYMNKDFSDVSLNSCIPSFMISKQYGADPVDMKSGAYTYETQDLSAGDTLSFNRIYNSNLNSENLSGLGNGWVHNYDIVATPRTAWEEALGNGTAEQSATFLASVYAAKDVLASESDTDSEAEIAKKWATCALIAKWGVDSILANSVSIRIGADTMQFVRGYQNSGTEKKPNYAEYYIPPLGTNYSLTTNSSSNYVLKIPYGDTMTFNSNNKIANIANIFGKKTSFSYNSSKNLTKVTDPYSRTISLTWNAGKISKVTCASKTATFSYSGNDLVSATDAVSKVWRYEYDNNSRMTVLKDPVDGGRIIVKNVYSEKGSVIAQYSCGDENKKWTFSYLDTRSEERDPLGNVRKFYYDDRGFCTKITDQNGYSTVYEFDPQGREVKREYPAILTSISKSDNGEFTGKCLVSRVSSAYDNWHNKLSEKVEELSYDVLLKPQADGRYLGEKLNEPLIVEKARTEFQYEEYDGENVPRLLKTTQKSFNSGENDRVKTIVSYYDKGSTKTAYPTETVDERGVTTKYAYDSNGMLTSETVGGRTTKYSSFSAGKPKTITYPDATTLKLTYNNVGDVLTETDSAGAKTAYTYDNKRRQLTSTKTAKGMPEIKTSTVYDDAGNVAEYTDEDGTVSETLWDSQKKKLSESSGPKENALTTKYEYDLADRQSSILYPDGSIVLNTFDPAGNILTSTRNGKTTTYSYNPRNWQTSVKTPLGNITSYSYDIFGNKTSMTDAHGYTVSYVYNSFGENAQVVNRNGGVFETKKDLSSGTEYLTTATGKVLKTVYSKTTGDLLSKVSPSGRETLFEYNPATGRLLSKTDDMGTVSYAYDKFGRLAGLSSKDSVLSYEYDAYGRIAASLSENGFKVLYSYTPGGKLASVTYPAHKNISAKKVNYEYDSLGRLSRIIDWAGRVTFYSYDSGGRLARIDRPNGTYREISYDPATKNLAGIAERKSDGSLIFSYSYVLDEDNRITGIERTPKNRIFPRNGFSASYDSDNKLKTFRGLNISYDNDGNMTSAPITESAKNTAFTYNGRGLLVSAGNSRYSYDSEGNRKALDFYEKGILTQYQYVYDKSGELDKVLMRAKLAPKTSETTYYIYGAGLAYEVKIDSDDAESARYYHHDQIGSTIAMTDDQGSITDRFSYDTWGSCIHSIGDSDTPFKYVGAYGIQTDPNGLINMRARYYNPATTTFISQDPSGFEGGLNWYLYANGNPYSYIDENGEFAVAAIVVGACIGAAVEAAINIYMQYDKMKSDKSYNFDFRLFALDVTKGLVIGGMTAIATPVSGSIALRLGAKATSSLSKGISVGYSASISATTTIGYNYASNKYLGTDYNLTERVGSSFLFGAMGQGVSHFIKPTGYSTILQATKFNAVPKTIPKYVTTYNGRLLSASFITSSSISAISNFK